MLKWLQFNRLGTALFTRRRGERVGEDEFGNSYYREAGASNWRDERRWVVYPDDAPPESSTVPAGWNAWLHHNLETVPDEALSERNRWEKEHLPNLTGTDQSYAPAGHQKRGGKRDQATGDYEAWTP